MRFLVKCLLLTMVLFFGVLLGMQEANSGLKKMRGENASFPNAFELSSNEQEAEVLGQTITTHDLKEKQKKLEEMESFNFFSTIGQKLTELIIELLKITIGFTTALFEKILQLIFQ
ncbi:DUF3679 domain-containing protein [Bacillus taeanensis]|nr:DUF3679 domain-containing protein [Bacillus taeanensis]